MDNVCYFIYLFFFGLSAPACHKTLHSKAQGHINERNKKKKLTRNCGNRREWSLCAWPLLALCCWSCWGWWGFSLVLFITVGFMVSYKILLFFFWFHKNLNHTLSQWHWFSVEYQFWLHMQEFFSLSHTQTSRLWLLCAVLFRWFFFPNWD